MKFLLPAAAVTLILTGLCIVIAMFLFQQQTAMTRVLRENVTSRRAAVDLEECLYDISALLHDDVDDVSALNDRIERHLHRLREVANQPEEMEASKKLDAGLTEYLGTWRMIPAKQDPQREKAVQVVLEQLEKRLIRPCQQFRLYNGRRIEQSTMQHESVLTLLAWGLTGIGVFGGIGGIVLGFGVTRALGRSIRRLQVRLQDAAGKLGPELPDIILTEEGHFSEVHAQLDQLTSGIEKVLLDLRQRELEVLRAEQLAAVGHLAASVAHEIRNPLTAIKMLIQAGQESGQPPLSPEDLRVIETEIRRMESSLKTFLDFTRPPRLERRSVRLSSLLQEVAGLVRGRTEMQKVDLSISVQDDSLVVMADPEQLRQVFVNLILNSLDALPRGGRIRVTVKSTEDSVELCVSDTGIGIASEMLPQLFQPFSSNKETGLGLGLVISKRIVEDHGGTISADNRPSGGAEFRVRLPKEPANSTA